MAVKFENVKNNVDQAYAAFDADVKNPQMVDGVCISDFYVKGKKIADFSISHAGSKMEVCGDNLIEREENEKIFQETMDNISEYLKFLTDADEVLSEVIN